MATIKIHKCKLCKKRFSHMLMLADDLWELVTPYKKDMLCGECVMKRLEIILEEGIVIHGRKWNY